MTKDDVIDVEVGAFILTSGGEVIDPKSRRRTGYGRYPNVVSSIQFERLLSASSPTWGTSCVPLTVKNLKK